MLRRIIASLLVAVIVVGLPLIAGCKKDGKESKPVTDGVSEINYPKTPEEVVKAFVGAMYKGDTGASKYLSPEGLAQYSADNGLEWKKKLSHWASQKFNSIEIKKSEIQGIEAHIYTVIDVTSEKGQSLIMRSMFSLTKTDDKWEINGEQMY